jgi:hypothetical protein
MNGRKVDGSLSRRAYALLLAAYPREFRREYGREMALVFADRCRDESRARGRAALARVWGEALLDLVASAPREHFERLGEEGLMRTLRTIALAAVAYAFTLLVVAPLYARNVGVLPGFVNSLIDALISTGLVFNFVFLLLTLTRWLEGVRAVRVALALTAAVVGVLITLVMVSAPAYVNVNIVVAQILSLLVWYTAHLWWVRRKARAAPPATA